VTVEEEFNAQVVDVPNLCPYEFDRVAGKRIELHPRSAYICSEVLCVAEPFSVGKTAAGKFVCLWPGHADLFDSLDDLRDSLNIAEKPLLP
jgi:hypothetical protein